jgi:hypothetical protein
MFAFNGECEKDFEDPESCDRAPFVESYEIFSHEVSPKRDLSLQLFN